MTRYLRYGLLLMLSAALAAACADGSSRNPYGAPDDFDPTDLPDGTATESWGISDLWYDYEFDGHKVSPRQISWVVRTPDDDAYFMHVKRYYGSDAQSGKPSMEILTWNAETERFENAQEWEAEERVTQSHICLNLQDASSTSCDGDYDILWRTDKRPVPEIGFAPSNPGLYVERRDGLKVYQYKGKTPPETLPIDEETISSKQCAVEQSFVTDDGQTPENTDEEEEIHSDCDILPWRIESAFDDHAIPLVTLSELSADQSIFQLTASIYAAQWHATIDEDNHTLTIDVRCTPAPSTQACAAPLDMDAQRISLALEDADTWTFVSLCELNDAQYKNIQGLSDCTDESDDPEDCLQTCSANDEDCTPDPVPTLCENAADNAPCITASQNDLRAGAWPDNRTFDLAVQITDEDVHVWIAPSQPIVVSDDPIDQDTVASRELWSLPGDEVCE